jgi:hypothetical protein
MAKAAFKTKKALFTSRLDLDLRKKLIKLLHLEHSLICAQTGTLQKVDQKYLGSYEMWCLRRMEGSVEPIV